MDKGLQSRNYMSGVSTNQQANRDNGLNTSEHEELVMGNMGMLGSGGVISENNMSLPQTETYASHANQMGLQIEMDDQKYGGEDLDDEEIDVVSNKPGSHALNGAPTASIRHHPRGRTEVSN